ncbi:MAG: CrcB family protein [Bifidobacterium subtile]|nr:CrcB family protein [Bifidobacterium subtile]MCI1241412.1 CrcB family protein [Bifidobacterium subtile]MCI1259001.1 CrcB family protein [Bifidobacterium subtile]
MNSRTRVLLQSVAAVFAGGSVGSLIRISLSKLQAPDASWPWMTLLINLTGSFILGCLLEYLATTGEDIGARRIWRLGLGTGVIGGYTTYSTFILETDTRITGHAVALALGYLVISVVAGLFCAGLGISAGERLGSRRNARAASLPAAQSVAQTIGASTPTVDTTAHGADDRPNATGSAGNGSASSDNTSNDNASSGNAGNSGAPDAGHAAARADAQKGGRS